MNQTNLTLTLTNPNNKDNKQNIKLIQTFNNLNIIIYIIINNKNINKTIIQFLD